MEFYEFLGVAYSMVLALGLAELLSAMPRVMTPARRAGIHLFWVGHMLFMHSYFWWQFWSYKDVTADDVTYLWMVFLLATPALLFVASKVLVSDEADEHRSWKEHFDAKRRAFFGCTIASWVAMWILEAEDMFNQDVLIGFGVFTIPLVVAMQVPAIRVQWIVAAIMFVIDIALVADEVL